MSKSYTELRRELESLQVRMTEVRQAEMGRVVSEIRRLVQEYELMPSDIFGVGRIPRPRRRVASTVVKYRHPVTGATWSGRGRRPKWIAGVPDPEKYRVA